VLFGKDTYDPTEYPYHWDVFEMRDEYVDYYRDYHGSGSCTGWRCPTLCCKSSITETRRRWGLDCRRPAGRSEGELVEFLVPCESHAAQEVTELRVVTQ
jgi:hypothetical protein